VSKEKFAEILNPPAQVMGIMEAVKEGVQAIAPGLSLRAFGKNEATGSEMAAKRP
jgi:hypothetical protein